MSCARKLTHINFTRFSDLQLVGKIGKSTFVMIKASKTMSISKTITKQKDNNITRRQEFVLPAMVLKIGVEH